MNAMEFNPASRIWIYTASRAFSEDETAEINGLLDQFTKNWTAHSKELLADGFVVHNRMVVLAVDESQAGASGCSIDSSVHFLKKLGDTYQTDLFVRNLVALKMDELWEWHDFKSIPELLKAGKISAETAVLDTTVTDLKGFQTWEKPLKNTWLSRYLN